MQPQRGFEHLVDKLNNPNLAQQNQAKYNDERFENVKNALRIRPVFLPVQIEMPAAVQSLPLSGYTTELKYPVIITGAITDGEQKKISFGFNNEYTKPFVSTNQTNTQLTLEAIAGKSLQSAGRNGIQEFEPFLLPANETLQVDVYKPVLTAGVEVVTICFVGYRVFSENSVSESLTEKIEKNVRAEIAKRITPQQRFDACAVTFADNKATTYTTKVDEPRLIYGFRTTVSDALVTLGFDNNEAFSKDYFPIWALASEVGNNPDNYRFLKRPIFLAAGEQLYFALKDSINGTVIAQNGQIELFETTV